ncbi:PCMD domain-containing protein [Chitinophaga pendula]|uniref:PCMD domain-containing protein n=1 Tax=Chitinophaga TaxID=79328 RepID=UPI000BB0BAF0|nr:MULTISPECIES: PCMD domain-containing protein [Chitinophaga]ASZ11139.1 hypothetical protein CK934_09280 [Chitinophaga sp. MD30]UCJ05863.1 PCMD domain-containing protein [Chitinophaga pendula]
MKNILHYIILSILIVLAACVKKDHFGPTDMKEIKAFTLEEQVGTTIIDNVRREIKITVAQDAYLQQLKTAKIELASFASIKPALGEAQDFTQPVTYTVIAEDGSTLAYKVIVTREGGNPQVFNADFNKWYEAETFGNKYTDIGESDKDLTWGTGNKGAALLGQTPTRPLPNGVGNFAAEMTTTDMGSLAAFLGKRTAAGSLFTGYLDASSIVNAAPVFGIPFRATPDSFRVRYSYAPGAPVMDGKGKTVAGLKDSCDIYVLLENRVYNPGDTVVKRLGTAWFRSGDVQADWKTLQLPIRYGQLPAGTPAYMLPQGRNERWGDPAKDKVTHVTVVFTSSARGNDYIGAWGSQLIVDDFQLLY